MRTKQLLNFKIFLPGKLKLWELIFKDQILTNIFKGTKTELPNLLTELFNNVDNGDGNLTAEELVELEGKLNKTITLEDAEQIISRWDSNGDGFFTVEEFIEYKSAQMS